MLSAGRGALNVIARPLAEALHAPVAAGTGECTTLSATHPSGAHPEHDAARMYVPDAGDATRAEVNPPTEKGAATSTAPSPPADDVGPDDTPGAGEPGSLHAPGVVEVSKPDGTASTTPTHFDDAPRSRRSRVVAHPPAHDGRQTGAGSVTAGESATRRDRQGGRSGAGRRRSRMRKATYGRLPQAANNQADAAALLARTPRAPRVSSAATGNCADASTKSLPPGGPASPYDEPEVRLGSPHSLATNQTHPLLPGTPCDR